MLALGRNIFKGSDEMLQAAKTKIADYRIAMRGKQKLGGNLGYVEGEMKEDAFYLGKNYGIMVEEFREKGIL